MSRADACPKCGVIWPPDKPLPVTACPDCGVVFSKFAAALKDAQRRQAEQAANDAAAAQRRAVAVARADAKASAAAAREREAQLAFEASKRGAQPSANLTRCAACGGTVAYGAMACPHCGARGPAKPVGKVKAIVYGGAVFLAILAAGGGLSGGRTISAACKPIDWTLVQLPLDKAEANADFIARAEQLQASGRCVVEGSFGRQTGLFYFAVQDGPSGTPYHVRYPREALAPTR